MQAPVGNLHFLGTKFIWFLGICEDNKDPNLSNRIKVRIVGHHPENGCNTVKTEDLPWAQVIMPPNSYHGNNSGTTVNILKGTFVVGFFLDEDQEYPVVFGILPQKDYKNNEVENNENLKKEIKKEPEFDCNYSFRRLYDPNNQGLVLTNSIKKQTLPQPATNNTTGTNKQPDNDNEIDDTNVADVKEADDMDRKITIADGRRKYSLCNDINKNLSQASNVMRGFSKKITSLELISIGNSGLDIGGEIREGATNFQFTKINERINPLNHNLKITPDVLGSYAYLADVNNKGGGVISTNKIINVLAFNKITGIVEDINQIISDYASMLTSALNGFIDNLKAQLMEQIKKIFKKLIPDTVRKNPFSTKEQIEVQDIILKLIQCLIEGLFNNLLGIIEKFLQELLIGCLEDIMQNVTKLIEEIISQLMGLLSGISQAIKNIIGAIQAIGGIFDGDFGGFDCDSFLDQVIDFLCELLGGNSDNNRENSEGDYISPRGGTEYFSGSADLKPNPNTGTIEQVGTA